MARRLAFQKHCPQLKEVRDYIVSLPSDICELLPFLEGYVGECDVVAEAGSRYGSSTSSILSQHPNKFISMDLVVTPELTAFHETRRECAMINDDAQQAALQAMMQTAPSQEASLEAKAYSATHTENRIIAGDDIAAAKNSLESVEFLFIDTLHNADQLFRELEVFPQRVTKWMAFHDSYSFHDHDEMSSVTRKDLAPGSVTWRGLYGSIRQFLVKNGHEWVEEMNFMHNNGFLVLRRRSWAPTVAAPHPLTISLFEEHVLHWDLNSPAAVFRLLRNRAWTTKRNLDCSRAYGKMSGVTKKHKSPNPMLCGGGHSFLFQEPTLRAITSAVRASDDIPVFDKATFPMGYAIAREQHSSGKLSFILNHNAAQSKLEQIVEAIAVLSVALGSYRQLNSQQSAFPRRDGSGPSPTSLSIVCLARDHQCNNANKRLIEPMRAIFPDLRDISFTHDLPSATDVDTSRVVFTTGAALRNFEDGEDFGGKSSRIYIHGTAIGGDTSRYQPRGYELKTALNEGVGIAVFEKKGSEVSHYVKL